MWPRNGIWQDSQQTPQFSYEDNVLPLYLLCHIGGWLKQHDHRFTPRSHGKPSGYLSLLSGRGDGPFFRTISLALLAVPHGGARWTPMRFGRFKICHRRVCACSCLKSKRMTGALHLVLTEESTPTLAWSPTFLTAAVKPAVPAKISTKRLWLIFLFGSHGPCDKSCCKGLATFGVCLSLS